MTASAPLPALIVVDMVRDNVDGPEHVGMAAPARAIVPAINRLLGAAHGRSWPVIFACDAFLPDDFIFGGRMRPHSVLGTAGAEPTDALDRAAGDLFLPKRRFSAFFGTGLEQTLRDLGVGRVLVCGITTGFCVLSTALDAVCHDFKAVLVEDACAAPTPALHEAALACYRKNALQPLLEVMSVEAVIAGLGPTGPST